MLDLLKTTAILHLFAFIGSVYSQFGSGGLNGPNILEMFGYQTRRLPMPMVMDQERPSTSNNVQMGRHHIIPAELFRAFFNAAVRSNGDNNTELSGVMNVIGYLSRDALVLYNGTNAVNQRVRTSLTELSDLQAAYISDTTENNPSLNVLFQRRYLVHSIIHWIPANIFIGPIQEHRLDDPGSEFEQNARYIIGEEDFQRFNTLRLLMVSYVHTGYRADYNEAIELISEISRGRNAPYPYDPDQWGYRIEFGVRMYYIRTYTNFRRKRRVVSVSLIDRDPYCLKPLETLRLTIKDNNLILTTIALDRAINNLGFYEKSRSSWKDYYARCNWNEIFILGHSMSGHEGYKPWGYKFDDGSFVVGITAMDTKHGTDNWVKLAYDFTTATSTADYAGQVYFDKNGRPVAIAITSDYWAGWGSGYSFIYNGGKWEYEAKDTWHDRRFSGTTLSLDPNAPRFLKEY